MRARAYRRIIVHMNAHVSELFRLINNLIRIGTIVEVEGIRARVKTGELITAWLRWIPARAGKTVTWWRPSIGEQVMVLSPGGDMSAAVILPSLYSDTFPSPSTDENLHIIDFPDDARIVYDSAAHALAFDTPGSVTINALSIAFNSGSLTHNGKNIGFDHKHSDVAPGASTTGDPV